MSLGPPSATFRRTSTGASGIGACTMDLAELYRAHAADVSRWARRFLGPHGDVEDVLHEVFLVVHRRLPEFRGDAKITTWLYAITVRVVQDRRRKERWTRWLRLGKAHVGGKTAPDDQQRRPPTPLQALEGRRAVELTYEILDTLTEAERSALIMFELEGMTGDQIAAITGDAVGTVWVRLHRARARFRKAFVKAEAAPRDRRRMEEVTP